jgi:pseudouridine-5'-phosphate glycosidase
MIAPFFRLADEVSQALAGGAPVVALESTVITHGLPYPSNRQAALEMEAEVRRGGAVAATIALLDGQVCVGLAPEQIERLARGEGMHKISRREFGPAVALGWSGGTTVAGTMLAAHQAGIRVFATGGIGGVHRQPAYDVSADLVELSRTPVLVVCAGAKAILDLDATLEYLETTSTPVVGYQTDEFPAFYSIRSGLKVSVRADTTQQIAAIARAHWALGGGGVLVGNPPPAESALEAEQIEQAVQAALDEAQAQGIRGQGVTPFLLGRVSALTGGASLQANLALLRGNARLGGQIAAALAGTTT